MIAEADIALAAPDGVTLEGRMEVPRGAPGGAVLCHPHPLYGGDMDNPVVIRCREVCFFGKLFPLGEVVATWVGSAFRLQPREPGRGGGAG